MIIQWFSKRTKYAQAFIISTLVLLLLAGVSIPLLSYSITKRNRVIKQYQSVTISLRTQNQELQTQLKIREQEHMIDKEKKIKDGDKKALKELEKKRNEMEIKLDKIRREGKENLKEVDKKKLDDLINVTNRILKEDLL